MVSTPRQTLLQNAGKLLQNGRPPRDGVRAGSGRRLRTGGSGAFSISGRECGRFGGLGRRIVRRWSASCRLVNGKAAAGGDSGAKAPAGHVARRWFPVGWFIDARAGRDAGPAACHSLFSI